MTDPVDLLLARALADPKLTQVPVDLSPAEQALATRIALAQANAVADELMQVVSPRSWANVKSARTSLGWHLRRQHEPAEASGEAAQGTITPQPEPQGLPLLPEAHSGSPEVSP